MHQWDMSKIVFPQVLFDIHDFSIALYLLIIVSKAIQPFIIPSKPKVQYIYIHSLLLMSGREAIW